MKLSRASKLIALVVVFIFALAILSRAGSPTNKALKEAGLVTFTTTDLNPIPANNPVTIFFEVLKKDGSPALLEVDHQRRLHTMVISSDLEKFEHFHSEDQISSYSRRETVGEWPLIVNFNRAGRYLVAQNFVVDGTRHHDLSYFDIKGDNRMGLYTIDTSRVRRLGDYSVELNAPETIEKEKPTEFQFLISRGGPLGDLQPHLGAALHLAVVRADLRHFTHTHGEPAGVVSRTHDGAMEDEEVLPEAFGPRLTSTLTFPTKGLYKIFGEFKHVNKVQYFNFMVEVD